MNYPKVMYVCSCRVPEEDRHEALLEFDERPPQHCPGNTPYRVDNKWIDPNRTLRYQPTVEAKPWVNWEIPGLSDRYAPQQLEAG
jgi:hypothetical protein